MHVIQRVTLLSVGEGEARPGGGDRRIVVKLGVWWGMGWGYLHGLLHCVVTTLCERGARWRDPSLGAGTIVADLVHSTGHPCLRRIVCQSLCPSLILRILRIRRGREIRFGEGELIVWSTVAVRGKQRLGQRKGRPVWAPHSTATAIISFFKHVLECRVQGPEISLSLPTTFTRNFYKAFI